MYDIGARGSGLYIEINEPGGHFMIELADEVLTLDLTDPGRSRYERAEQIGGQARPCRRSRARARTPARKHDRVRAAGRTISVEPQRHCTGVEEGNQR